MQKLIRYIFSNSCKTEVSDFEYFGSQTLSEQLSKEGFIIELPTTGHGCEHNVFG